MTDHDDVQHRAYYQPDPADVNLREEGDEGDTFSVRMPIASTGEVRNEGDDPLERDALEGMATQINDGDVGVFLAHGKSFEISDARYGQTERLGSWESAEVDGSRAGDDESMLVADAVLADPETLPDETGRYRETLSIIKEQVKRDIPLSSSIGWREEENAPGGNDLMEASIVGIPADPRTNTNQDATVSVLARAAVDSGADPEALVEEVRDAVMGSNADEGGNARDSVTDETTEPDDEQSEGTDDEQTERQEAPEWGQRMLELQEAQAETLQSLAESLREDDDDDDEEENEDDGDDDDDDEEQSAGESDEERDLREEVESLREELTEVRESGDIDTPDTDPDDEQDAETDEEREAEGQAADGPDWRA